MNRPTAHPGTTGARVHAAFTFALLACVAACGRSGAKEASPQYNVLLISVDTLRADRLNCYGYADRTTSPNIDALAQDGILFENFISASPWTTPAHMSLVTSLYPSSHGVIESFVEMMPELDKGGNFNKLAEARVTLAEALQAHGYATAAFTGGITVDARIGFGQGFASFDNSMYKLNETNMAAMSAWLERHQQGPSLVFWHTFEVHTPYVQTDFLADILPPEREAAVRQAIEQRAQKYGTFASTTPEHYRYIEWMTGVLTRQGVFRKEVCEALYLGGVRSMDEWLGRLVAKLRALDLYDRTMIILTSDHGEEFADHDPRNFYDSHGHTTFEEIIRVPLIVKLPEQRYAGTRVDAIARTIDVMPTILDVAGIDLEDSEMQGDSLRPLWDGTAPPLSRVAYSEGASAPYEEKCVRTERFKYQIWIHPEVVAQHGRSHVPEGPLPRQLFDLQADPLELNNLLAGSVAPTTLEIATALDGQMRAFVAAQHGDAERVQLDEETIRRLKALGYMK